MKTTLNGPWLFDVPEGWDVQRLSRVGRIVGGGTPSKSDSAFWEGTIPWASPKDIKTRLLVDTKDHISERGVRESSTTIVPSGTLLIVTRSGILRHRLPVAIATKPLALNQDLKGLIPNADTHPGYLAYWIEAHGRLLLSFWRKEGTTVESLETDLIKQTPVPLPPPSTQRAISSFLDRETGKIDTLIEKKQRLLELLEEKRTALITRAVTKGLDPDVPMKDSGVEWLGEIPEHWEVVTLKRLWKSADYGIADSGREGGRYSVLTMGDIERGRVTVPKSRGVDEVRSYLLLRPGDLLFNRTNSRDLVGKVGLYRGDPGTVTFASYLVRLRPIPRVSPVFLNFLLNSKPILAQARARSLLSVNQANLNPTRYGEIPVPIPPSDEQLILASSLKKRTVHLTEVRQHVTAAISLLQEYRTALISATVTGKIDVTTESAA